jgi:hypothetical protein
MIMLRKTLFALTAGGMIAFASGASAQVVVEESDYLAAPSWGYGVSEPYAVGPSEGYVMAEPNVGYESGYVIERDLNTGWTPRRGKVRRDHRYDTNGVNSN